MSEWTIERCEQLKKLESLIRHAQSINTASGCIERFCQCIAIACELRANRGLELSFLEFLHLLAIDGMREKPSAPELIAENQAMHAENERLRARVAELEADKKRIDWLSNEEIPS